MSLLQDKFPELDELEFVCPVTLFGSRIKKPILTTSINKKVKQISVFSISYVRTIFQIIDTKQVTNYIFITIVNWF